jgi:hypothetical protein
VRAMVVLNRCQHRERDSDQRNEDEQPGARHSVTRAGRARRAARR